MDALLVVCLVSGALLFFAVGIRLEQLSTRIRYLERIACDLEDNDPDGPELKRLRGRILHEEEAARYQDLSGGLH